MAKKKKKQRPKMPKLSALDKCIYWAIFLVLCLLLIVIFAIPYVSFKSIAFAEESVVASEQGATVLWALVPFMTVFLVTLIIWCISYEGKRPIFGIRGYSYGPPRHPSIYPLLQENKPAVWVSEKKKRGRKTAALTLLAVLLIGFIPYPFAFFGRDSLHYDGSVTHHNAINTQTEDYTSGEIVSVEFSVYSYRFRRHYFSRHWSVKMTLTTDDGKKYGFSASDFRNFGEGNSDWLTAMIALKQSYDLSIIWYSDQHDLEKVAADFNMNEDEIALLYQLFAIE